MKFELRVPFIPFLSLSIQTGIKYDVIPGSRIWITLHSPHAHASLVALGLARPFVVSTVETARVVFCLEDAALCYRRAQGLVFEEDES